MAKLTLALKAARELGPQRILNALLYRAGLRSGWYRARVLPPQPGQAGELKLPDLSAAGFDAPPRERIDGLARGFVEIFGAVNASLDFSLPGPLGDWTRYETGRAFGQDIKFIWEPARFCWTADLVRAYHHDPDERLPALFQARLAEFLAANPPYRGPNWASGQEVGLRLIHLVLAAAVLGAPEGFADIIAVHAARIPPTLGYARAQANNHLLSEAAALLTAGTVLPAHPEAQRWFRLGLESFEAGILGQVLPEGVYTQQSVNYHRLVLQLALWCRRILRLKGRTFSDRVQTRLGAAAAWLAGRCDPATGAVPNLGANDGAFILPLSGLPYADFRPVIQAACRAFRGQPAFGAGPWDEMGAWLGVDADGGMGEPFQSTPGRIDHPALPSTAYLRAARFHGRPGHADQLHVDLWRDGRNIALDPGTYLYNGEPPWDNPLQSAFHHNTLTVDGRDQMTPAGRFLYVDRAAGRFLPVPDGMLSAEHDGYRSLGIVHRRTLETTPDGWLVRDRLVGSGDHSARLHWLLPDGEWELNGSRLDVRLPDGTLRLAVDPPQGSVAIVDLVRAGESLAGTALLPTLGWTSPTYGVRLPALSLSVTVKGELPLEIKSTWTLRRL